MTWTDLLVHKTSPSQKSLKLIAVTLLKIKVVHDAIEEPFCLKWFHKEPLTSE